MSIQDGLNKRRNRTEEEKAKRRELQIQTGNRLRRLREDKSISQQEMADMLGFGTQAAYGKLEGGDVALHPRQCIMLADYFGVTCDYILRGIDAENVDVCHRTGLTQETFETLTKQHLIECELKRARDAYDFDAIPDFEQSVIRRGVLNHLVNHSVFWNEIKAAIHQAVKENNTYWGAEKYFSDHPEEKKELPSKEEANFDRFQKDQHDIVINAAKYIAGQAFGDFINDLLKEHSFYEYLYSQESCFYEAEVIEYAKNKKYLD